MPAPTSARRWRSPLGAGVAGALLIFLSIAGLVAATYPPYLSADEPHHIDYAWRLGHGELPEFHDGVTAPLGPPDLPIIQFVWQHPPAFYVLEAPIVTPLLDAGHWRLATLLGRLIPLAFGAATVVAIAAVVRRLSPRTDPALVVGAAAVAAVANPLLGVSAAIYNDSMAVLASTIALGAAVRLLRLGPSTRWYVVLALACTVGFSTRATFVTTFLVSAAAALWVAIRGPVGARADRARALAGAAAVVVLPLLATGWVWARNIRLVGNWTGSQPEAAVTYLNRTIRTPFEVLTTFDIWRVSLGGLFPQPADPARGLRGPHNFAFAVVAIVALLALARAVVTVVRRGGWRQHVPVALLLGGAVAGVLVQQAQHATNGGAPNARYLLPALLPIVLAAAYGLLWARRCRGLLLVGFAVLSAGTFLLQATRVMERRLFGTVGVWDAFRLGLEANSIPVVVLPLALAGVVVGLATVGWTLWRLTAPTQPEK